MSETPNISSDETDPAQQANKDSGPWGEEYQKSVPEFAGDTPEADESPKNKRMNFKEMSIFGVPEHLEPVEPAKLGPTIVGNPNGGETVLGGSTVIEQQPDDDFPGVDDDPYYQMQVEADRKKAAELAAIREREKLGVLSVERADRERVLSGLQEKANSEYGGDMRAAYDALSETERQEIDLCRYAEDTQSIMIGISSRGGDAYNAIQNGVRFLSSHESVDAPLPEEEYSQPAERRKFAEAHWRDAYEEMAGTYPEVLARLEHYVEQTKEYFGPESNEYYLVTSYLCDGMDRDKNTPPSPFDTRAGRIESTPEERQQQADFVVGHLREYYINYPDKKFMFALDRSPVEGASKVEITPLEPGETAEEYAARTKSEIPPEPDESATRYAWRAFRMGIPYEKSE